MVVDNTIPIPNEDVLANRVDVAISSTGGLGVFMGENVALKPGDIVTEYPGNAVWMDQEAYMKKKHTTYVYSWGPRHVPGQGTFYLVWEPPKNEIRENIRLSHVGHLLNSSHPQLNHPFRSPTCCFGIRFGENFVLSTDVPPDVRLFIIAIKPLHYAEYGVETGWELLLDYHWQLTLEHALHCLDFDCYMCFLALKDVVRMLAPRFKRLSTQK